MSCLTRLMKILCLFLFWSFAFRAHDCYTLYFLILQKDAFVFPCSLDWTTLEEENPWCLSFPW